MVNYSCYLLSCFCTVWYWRNWGRNSRPSWIWRKRSRPWSLLRNYAK